MQDVSRATQTRVSSLSRADRLKDFMTAFAVLAAAALLFALLFNRETVLSYSIGYNLYGAERILDGEVPYRDFHTLYPPATVYLNAALFKLMGVSLYNALLGVALFKTLTAFMIYLCGRNLMPRSWAVVSAAFSLLWLRPNGPFKAVPMHYGALFLALALYLLIKYHGDKKPLRLFAAGVALGVLALFKHNIGGYALAGSLVLILLEGNQANEKNHHGDTEGTENIFLRVLRVSVVKSHSDSERLQKKSHLAIGNARRNYRRALLFVTGFALPIIPVLVYMQSQGALAPMIKTLLFGPGEFLLSRLAALPSPLVALLTALFLAACAFASYRLKANPRLCGILWIAVIATLPVFLLGANQDLIDSLIFYAPVAIIAGGLAAGVFGHRFGVTDRMVTLAVTVTAASAFMESFPRFAREQSIAAMSFIALLLFYLLYNFKPLVARLAGEGIKISFLQLRLAAAVLPLMLFVMGSRLFFDTYFDIDYPLPHGRGTEGRLQLKSDTELQTERGRGVYFPAERAREIDSVTRYIERRVEAGGYFFAQSYAGSSYLFLADRNNPSGAQFWGGVGVTEEERAETLKAIEEKHVHLIVTSRKDLEAETYQPMRDYINKEFRPAAEAGDTLILERLTEPR